MMEVKQEIVDSHLLLIVWEEMPQSVGECYPLVFTLNLYSASFSRSLAIEDFMWVHMVVPNLVTRNDRCLRLSLGINATSPMLVA
jgi:hypothetical protein